VARLTITLLSALNLDLVSATATAILRIQRSK
jgi:hypothetical protein